MKSEMIFSVGKRVNLKIRQILKEYLNLIQNNLGRDGSGSYLIGIKPGQSINTAKPQMTTFIHIRCILIGFHYQKTVVDPKMRKAGISWIKAIQSVLGS